MLALLFAVGCGDSTRDAADQPARTLPTKLRVGVIPNIAPDRQKARYEPFRAYLARTLGVDVDLFVATDYAGVVSALASDNLDVAYLGGLTYVQAEQQVPLVPLVTEVDRETGTREYLSSIVVKSSAPFSSVRDLVQATASFAFGDVSSTSGSLYPRAMLVDAGARCSTRDLLSCPPLEKVSFTGGHDATAQAVLGGTATAGGLELRILRRLEADGSVPTGALKVLESRSVMGYPWVVRADAVSEAGREALVGAFTAIDDPALLDLLRAKTYERVSASDYDEVRELATRLGLRQKQ
ncbi:MAG: phosphate/phosphite/phosphonate ABC transporter substrate-binding protein [Actinomycetota bacterium]|nr:phosphate/phosphite/phosphonate ABC transporter substrate-binding protein [Actinomycetota bacterium]